MQGIRHLRLQKNNHNLVIAHTMGTYHLSELAGQTSPFVKRIPLLIRTVQTNEFIYT